jgi:hypothetical protein
MSAMVNLDRKLMSALCPIISPSSTFDEAQPTVETGQIQAFGTAGKAHLFCLLSGAREN